MTNMGQLEACVANYGYKNELNNWYRDKANDFIYFHIDFFSK